MPTAPRTAPSSDRSLTVHTLAAPSAPAILDTGEPRGLRPLDDHSPATSLERCILLSRFVI
ncbi:MAG: hypothetical protein WD669_00200 [Pirellulales bacterium]